MQRVTRFFTGVVTLSLTISACGDGGPESDRLEAAEVQEVFDQLVATVEVAIIDVVTAPARAAAATIPEISAMCPAGGSVSVSGSYGQTVFSTTVDLTQNINGCGIPLADVTVTLDGDPDIGIAGEITGGGPEVSVSVELDGGFTYSVSDGRSGACEVMVSLSGTFNLETFEENIEAVSGTICGFAASGFVLSVFGAS